MGRTKEEIAALEDAGVVVQRTLEE
jgi:hypothetical protein